MFSLLVTITCLRLGFKEKNAFELWEIQNATQYSPNTKKQYTNSSAKNDYISCVASM